MSRNLLAFTGITDVLFIRAHGLAMGPESRARGMTHARTAIEQEFGFVDSYRLKAS